MRGESVYTRHIATYRQIFQQYYYLGLAEFPEELACFLLEDGPVTGESLFHWNTYRREESTCTECTDNIATKATCTECFSGIGVSQLQVSFPALLAFECKQEHLSYCSNFSHKIVSIDLKHIARAGRLSLLYHQDNHRALFQTPDAEASITLAGS